jgi:hypothetical protein
MGLLKHHVWAFASAKIVLSEGIRRFSYRDKTCDTCHTFVTVRFIGSLVSHPKPAELVNYSNSGLAGILFAEAWA